MANDSLGDARKAKNDEFYTQFADIEKEMNAYLEYDEDVFRDKVVLLPCDDPEWSNFTKYFAQNFERLGLKRLISTSYAPNSKPQSAFLNPTLFELEDPQYDEVKSVENGKIFVLDRDINGDNKIDVEDLQWKYLDGNGDFQSDEITALRDEADVIVTNPPFSLFRPFLAWIVEANKQFAIIGNMNAITYKEVFPLIKDNEMWLGVTRTGVGFMYFEVPPNSPQKQGQKFEDGKLLQTIGNSAWFTNIEHGRRHQPLKLMTEAENIRFSSNKAVKNIGYQRYDNYDAIEVPAVDAIPSDFPGVMGVPITFLGKYNPDQFEILGSRRWAKSEILGAIYRGNRTVETDKSTLINSKETYDRIFIRHKRDSK